MQQGCRLEGRLGFKTGKQETAQKRAAETDQRAGRAFDIADGIERHARIDKEGAEHGKAEPAAELVDEDKQHPALNQRAFEGCDQAKVLAFCVGGGSFK